MKKIIFLFVAFAAQMNFAQSTFPIDGGNVGIGTLSPTSKLEVLGTIKNYESAPLGATLNSTQLINEVGGSTGTANKLYRRLWLSRDNPSSANWWTARLHDGISIDASFNAAQVDTKTWWERDPNDNIQSWGNAAETYLTINKGNVGIGTTTPSNIQGWGRVLDVSGDLHSKILATSGGSGYKVGLFSHSSWLGGGGFVGTESNHPLNFITNYSPKMTILPDGNVGIGIFNPTNKLDVNGTIHSKEVRVDMTGWSDFVFKKEYNLPTLEDVEKHITEKGHLENIPSEEEVVKNGINLGEMNSKLLQKIEELTLYNIQQQKELNSVKAKLEKIENLLNGKLETRN